ncbi:MAG: hypothetical protein LBG72_04930 [Spirochaetaceae bacterium]|nr:hypothetical protein [Spirochaetaceae bacterium]
MAAAAGIAFLALGWSLAGCDDNITNSPIGAVNAPITWTEIAEGISPFNAIAFGGGKFVAVGNGEQIGWEWHAGKVRSSPDGITWTPYTAPLAEYLFYASNVKGISYGGDRFVAVGDGGINFKSAYSTDGTTWTASGTPPGYFNKYGAVFYGGSSGHEKFIIGNGKYTIDGTTWQGSHFIYSDKLVYGAGKWVSINTSPSISIRISDDEGETWGRNLYPLRTGSAVLTSCEAVVYGGKENSEKFVIAGNYEDDNGNAAGMTAYSTTGETWTVKEAPQWKSANCIAYGGGKFVMFAVDGNWAYSEDGITWNAGKKLSGEYKAITYGNNRFVAVGSNGKIAYSNILAFP